MAANKFATILHRNTNRVTVILVYTLLEWTLLALLLLNALFSFLIAKFASYFGLKPPCLFCSRVDHVFEPKNGRKSYKDLVCDAHAAEISQLGYCSDHRKLAEASGMCEECSASRPSAPGTDRTIAMFSWMKGENGGKDLRCSCCDVPLEDGFYSPYFFLKPSWGSFDYTQKGDLIKEKITEEDEKGSPEAELISQEQVQVGDHQVISPDWAIEGFEKQEEVKDEEVEGEGEEKADAILPGQEVTASIQSSGFCLKANDDFLDNLSLGHEPITVVERLLPVELIDSTTLKSLKSHVSMGGDDEEFGQGRAETPVSIMCDGMISEKNEALVSTLGISDAEFIPITETADKADECSSIPIEDSNVVSMDPASFNPQTTQMISFQESIGDLSDLHSDTLQSTVEISDIESIPITETADKAEECSATPIEDFNGVPTDSPTFNPQRSQVFLRQELIGDLSELQTVTLHSTPTISPDNANEAELVTVEGDSGEARASEGGTKMNDTGANCEISIGSEICEQELIGEVQVHEPLLLEVGVDGQSFENFNQETDKDQEIKTELEIAEQGENDLLSVCSEQNEVESEKQPETPNYIDGLHNLHPRFLFERRDGTESVEGSVVSEFDGTEILAVDHLKAALKAERKALSALYAELEEERNASAIAANQTMAMITRLQEEKAAMQTEALQYQRMMEEQSEYDQEALQFLNELMIKREKEKQDLEKEVESYRKKVLLYEAMDRRKMKTNESTGRSGTSSGSSSSEESDDISSELNGSNDNLYGLSESNLNTPEDAVLSSGTVQQTAKHLVTLDVSLSDFEEERLSILEQLRVLEQKLFTLDDEEPPMHVEGVEHFPEENGHGSDRDCEISNNDSNDFANGFLDDVISNEKQHHEKRNISSRGKRLLPLFDAVSVETDDDLCEEQGIPDVARETLSNFASEQKKFAIAAELDNVYERLQSLEADREFIKHCLNSLKKGDKGMDLLQEILQHLRDLKTVELQVRNAGDALASLSAQ